MRRNPEYGLPTSCPSTDDSRPNCPHAPMQLRPSPPYPQNRSENWRSSLRDINQRLVEYSLWRLHARPDDDRCSHGRIRVTVTKLRGQWPNDDDKRHARTGIWWAKCGRPTFRWDWCVDEWGKWKIRGGHYILGARNKHTIRLIFYFVGVKKNTKIKDILFFFYK